MNIHLIYCTLLILLFKPIYPDNQFNIQYAKIQGSQHIEIIFSGKPDSDIVNQLKINPEISIGKVELLDSVLKIFTDQSLLPNQHYYLQISDDQRVFLVPDGVLDSLYSEKPLGYQISENLIF